MPPERRLSLYSRESSVLSEPQTTIRAQSVPRFVPALPTPRAILLSSGYQPYVRMYHRPVYRPVVSYRPTPARFVVRPTRPVMRPVMRKRKSRKIRVVKNPVRDVLADPLPPIPHLKQWSASPRVLARPWVPSTRMFPLEERCLSLDVMDELERCYSYQNTSRLHPPFLFFFFKSYFKSWNTGVRNHALTRNMETTPFTCDMFFSLLNSNTTSHISSPNPGEFHRSEQALWIDCQHSSSEHPF